MYDLKVTLAVASVEMSTSARWHGTFRANCPKRLTRTWSARSRGWRSPPRL